MPSFKKTTWHVCIFYFSSVKYEFYISFQNKYQLGGGSSSRPPIGSSPLDSYWVHFRPPGYLPLCVNPFLPKLPSRWRRWSAFVIVTVLFQCFNCADAFNRRRLKRRKGDKLLLSVRHLLNQSLKRPPNRTAQQLRSVHRSVVRTLVAGGLFLIYVWQVTTLWANCPLWVSQPG